MRRLRSARPLRLARRTVRRPVTRRVGKGYLTVIPFDFAKANSRARRNNGQQHALSPDQQEALEKILAALNEPTDGRKVLVLAGPAGTGKTTLMRALLSMLTRGGTEVALLAPTGKAASRLRESTGMDTSTIHSFIYSGASELGICPNCGEISRELALSKREMKESGMKGLTCPACQTFYPIGTKLKTALAFKDQQGGQGKNGPREVGMAIIDEASMVSQALQQQMFEKKPNLHVLYVGDREQLPPFGETEADRTWGPDFDKPTALLTQIHRQAADNPIISWATRLREDANKENPFIVGKEDPDLKIQFFVKPVTQQIAEWYAHQVAESRSAVVLCSSNEMTAKVNAAVREVLPFAGTNRSLAGESAATGLPYVAGDLLMCIFNKRSAGLMNGEIFSVIGSSEIGPKLTEEGFSYVTIRNAHQEQTFIVYNKMAALSARDAGEEKKEVDSYAKRWKQLVEGVEQQYGKEGAKAFLDEMDPEDLFRSYKVINPNRVLHAVYGYAITVQKSQGSQWQSVGVVWDAMRDRAWTGSDYTNTRRWLYTAITRTSDRVAVFDMSGRYSTALRGEKLERMGVSLPAATTKKDMTAFMAPFQPRWEAGDEYTEVELARLLDRPSVPGLLFSRACLETLLRARGVFSDRTNDAAYAKSLAARWKDVPLLTPGEPVDYALFEPFVANALHHDTVRFLTKFRKRLAEMAPKFSSRRREGLISKVNPRRARRVRHTLR
jgi:energy-coupling factor transporter ATP-binding protein EcfA2